MTYEVGRDRIGRLIRAFFDIKGQAPINVEGEILPTFDVLDPIPEFEFLKGDVLAQGFGEALAFVGEESAVDVTLPISSTRVAIIERILIIPGATLTARIGLGPTPGITALGSTESGTRDGRWDVQRPTLIFNQGHAIGAVPTERYLFLPVFVGTSVEVVGPWIITDRGNRHFTVGSQDANTLIRVNFWWRERELERGEA